MRNANNVIAKLKAGIEYLMRTTNNMVLYIIPGVASTLFMSPGEPLISSFLRFSLFQLPVYLTNWGNPVSGEFFLDTVGKNVKSKLEKVKDGTKYYITGGKLTTALAFTNTATPFFMLFNYLCNPTPENFASFSIDAGVSTLFNEYLFNRGRKKMEKEAKKTSLSSKKKRGKIKL